MKPLLTALLLLGWIMPLAAGMCLGVLCCTYRPVSDFDNWHAVGFGLGAQAFLLLGAFWLGAALLARCLGARIRRPFPPGYCGHCGYDLRGQVEMRCPECGKRCESEQIRSLDGKARS